MQAVLAARIDRLAEREKQVLQTAAVIGREFSEPILAAWWSSPRRTWPPRSRAHGAEFLYEEALYPQAEYTFKHPLTQEVAYNSLLNERRQTLHERTGEAIGDGLRRTARGALQRSCLSLQPPVEKRREGGRLLDARR